MYKKKKQNLKAGRGEKGITLLMLVITIIILIILATVSINAVVGENGLIQSAKNSKDSAENEVAQQTGKMNSLLTEYSNIMAEDAEITEPGEGANPGGDGGDEPEPQPGDPIDGTLAVGPQVSDGMTPVKYIEGTGWVKTTATDEEWYNYSEKKWANIVLGDATFSKSGSYEILDENSTYSMLVWIPRYAYKITSMYHQSGSGAGTIEIVFLNTANEDKDGNSYSGKTAYPSASTGSGMVDYVVHPSFNWDGVPLAGYWVGKFESSIYEGKVQIKGGVQSWRSISVNNIHNICVGMNNSGNSYGSSLVNAPSRYKDVYSSYTAPTSGGLYGDAVWETSSSSSGSSSWYNDYSYFLASNNPFFRRGGYYGTGSGAGLFYFNNNYGYSYSDYSFRVVVPVL